MISFVMIHKLGTHRLLFHGLNQTMEAIIFMIILLSGIKALVYGNYVIQVIFTLIT